MVYARWILQATDIQGNSCEIPFYVVQGDGPLLLGNNVLACSNLLGSENLLVIPPMAGGISKRKLVFGTFTAQLRTFLHLIPSHLGSLNTYFSSRAALMSRNKSIGISYSTLREGKQAKEFAIRLHGYTHLHPNDMVSIAKSAGIYTSVLDQAFWSSFEKCTTCKMTGLPKHSRKISFNRILTSFNHRLQMDFLFIKEMGKEPILHLCDVNTSFSVAVQLPSRDMDIVCQTLRTHWFDVYGPPAEIIGDPEFDNSYVKNMLQMHDCDYKASPARRHNKIGIVESNHRMIRLLTERLFVDAAHNHRTHGIQITNQEILSRAVFLKNILRGGRKLSSFELAKGYSPSIKGIPQSLLPKEAIRAHFQQVARRAVSRFLSIRQPLVIKKALLEPKTEIYYWVKGISKGGTWKRGYIKEAKQELVLVHSNLNGRGAARKIAYEDIRLAPSCSLLKELDDLNFSPTDDQFETPETQPSASNEVQETTQFAFHQNRASYLSDTSAVDTTTFQVGKRSITQDISKDVGNTVIPGLQEDVRLLEIKSMEQHILANVLEVLGTEHVPVKELGFLPQWVIDKAIKKELENYSGGYEEHKIESLPRSANVISSHAFFHVKKDGENNSLRLKCRLVPHGNRDKDKDKVRSDCATAQFPVIRLILSLTALFPFKLGSIDITGAYLQGDPLNRDVYMRPPKGWCKPGMVWKLLRAAYGLTDSGRIWQMTIENWLLDNGFEQVNGIPQFFVLRNTAGLPTMFLVKVVDDFLMSSTVATLIQFNQRLSKAFKVGKFDTGRVIRFNGTVITDDIDGIKMDMCEYFSNIPRLEITRARRKQRDEPCTSDEVSEYLGLAGKLNFLGHGTLPQAGFVASHLQQALPRLKVCNLITANTCLHELRNLIPMVFYPRCIDPLLPSYIAFSDASMGRYTYGQTGYVSGISFHRDSTQMIHIIDWHSSKQTRISFSSIGAEIIAASESADRSSLMNDCISRVCIGSTPLPLSLIVDSMGLYGTITTLHEGRDYRLRPTVARLRDCYEGGEIHTMQWIPGKCNVADALTKRNPASYRMLNEVLSTGLIPSSILDSSHRVSAAESEL